LHSCTLARILAEGGGKKSFRTRSFTPDTLRETAKI